MLHGVIETEQIRIFPLQRKFFFINKNMIHGQISNFNEAYNLNKMSIKLSIDKCMR